jgi:hypothetical protein
MFVLAAPKHVLDDKAGAIGPRLYSASRLSVDYWLAFVKR